MTKETMRKVVEAPGETVELEIEFELVEPSRSDRLAYSRWWNIVHHSNSPNRKARKEHLRQADSNTLEGADLI